MSELLREQQRVHQVRGDQRREKQTDDTLRARHAALCESASDDACASAGTCSVSGPRMRSQPFTNRRESAKNPASKTRKRMSCMSRSTSRWRREAALLDRFYSDLQPFGSRVDVF